MAASLEGARERWDRMNSREQRLVTLFGVAVLVCVVAALVSSVKSNMAELEKSNNEARKALQSLAIYRNAKEKAKTSGIQDKIPEKAVELDSYLESIISELSLTSPTYPAVKVTKIGLYEELSFEIRLKGLSLESLAELLKKIETRSKLVVVKEMNVDRNFRDKEKLDLQFTVATFRKVAKKQESEGKNGDAEGEER